MIEFRFHAIRPTGIKYSLWTIDYGHYAIHGGESIRSAYFTQILTEISMIQHIYNLFQEYSTLDSPDLSPGSTPNDKIVFFRAFIGKLWTNRAQKIQNALPEKLLIPSHVQGG